MSVLNSGNIIIFYEAILLFFNKILKILMKCKIILKKVSPFWVLLNSKKFKIDKTF